MKNTGSTAWVNYKNLLISNHKVELIFQLSVCRASTQSEAPSAPSALRRSLQLTTERIRESLTDGVMQRLLRLFCVGGQAGTLCWVKNLNLDSATAKPSATQHSTADTNYSSRQKSVSKAHSGENISQQSHAGMTSARRNPIRSAGVLGQCVLGL